MTGLNESKKRDFVAQLVELLTQNAALLTSKGFDPTALIAELTTVLEAANAAEVNQMEAAAAAKDATLLANQTLNQAYTAGSAAVDLMAGLLGKKDNLVIEVKKLRKNPKPRTGDTSAS